MRYAFAGRRIAFLAAALLALVACGDDSPTDPGTDGPASVKVAESTLTLIALGDSALLTATVHDKSGAVIPNAVVTWSSTDSSVVAVRTNGWAVAKANGSATVVARSGDVADSVAVTVAQVAAGLSLAETLLTFTALGDSAFLTATVHDKSGAVISDAVVAWSTEDSAVVAVREDGWVVAKANGSATVVAHYGDVSDSVAVTVAQVVASLAAIVDSLTLGQGDTARVEIVAKDANGAAIANPGVTWSSSAATLVGVDEGGLVTAHRAGGRAAITATAGAVSAEIAVRVMDQIVIQRPFTRLFIVNEDGSGLEPLTDAGWTDSEPTWSPDGSKLAFRSNREGRTNIFVMNADGTGLVNVSHDTIGFNLEITWSPDGSKLAFRSTRDGNYEIYVVNVDGTGLVNVSNDAEHDVEPVWSPDGTKIAFASRRDGNYEIYVTDPDGSNPTRLTNALGDDLNPAWSPDGTKIAFTRYGTDGIGEIYVMDANGDNQTNLTNHPAIDELPVWSPDGSRIAFRTRRHANGFDLYVVDAAGGPATGLSQDADGQDFVPAWSPDGTRLLFRGKPGSLQHLFLVDVAGGTPKRLTDVEVNEEAGAWRPRPPSME